MTDEDVLCEFVIWQIRQRDLPADVAAAAERLAPQYPRRSPGGAGYLEAEYEVSGVPRNDADPVERVHAFTRAEAAAHTEELLGRHWYVVISRTPE